MFSHVTIGTGDLARAVAFYDAALAPLGLERVPSKYETWAARGDGWMAAFAAPPRPAVDAAQAAAVAAGRLDEGAPGPRPHFTPNYYGAYVRDPDGNKLHFVRRGE